MQRIKNLIVGGIILVLVACSATAPKPYQDFMSKNPKWVQDNQVEAGMRAEKALASAFGPRLESVWYYNNIKKVYDHIDGYWILQEFPIADLYSTNHLRLIISEQKCSSSKTGYRIFNPAYYMIQESKLIGYAHAHYGKDCNATVTYFAPPAPDFLHLIDGMEWLFGS